MESSRHPDLLRRNDAVLAIVDVQERLFPQMQDKERLLRRIVALIRGARILGVPIIVSEQYVKGLGRTAAPILEAAEGCRVVEKNSFSCMGDEGFAAALRETERTQLLVAGIETHICVLQTCFDARARGWQVFVAADATSTRLEHTHAAGLERIVHAGVAPVTVEGALFELLERCDSEAFKKILPLVREGA